jgi:hypothetical protein
VFGDLEVEQPLYHVLRHLDLLLAAGPYGLAFFSKVILEP